MSIRYSAGDGNWLAVAAGGRALLLEARAGQDRVDELLDALTAADPVAALLELLLPAGLAAMPAFGYAEVTTTGSRAIIRGAVSADLDGRLARGSDYSTWGEQRAEGGARAVLTAPGGDDTAAALPLEIGAAFAGSLTVSAGSARPAAPLPASAAAEPTRATPDGPQAEAGPAAEAPAPAPEFEPERASSQLAARPQEPAAVPTAPVPVPEAPPAAASADELPSAPEQTIAEFTSSEVDTGYAHLFEETIVRPIEHAAVRDDEQGDEDAQQDPEHDGMTIVSGELKKLREAAAADGERPAPTATEVVVPELRFSNGLTQTLSAPVIVGRAPSSGKVSAGRLPTLVTIEDDPDISRSHVQIEVVGDTVVVTDLHSRNGTSVVLPGRAPERLRGGIPTTVIDGAVIDLGGGLTIELAERGAARS